MTVAEACEHIAHKGENTNTHRILIRIIYVRRTVEIISQMSGEVKKNITERGFEDMGWTYVAREMLIVGAFLCASSCKKCEDYHE